MLCTEKADAFWITSWPFAQFVKHAWAGAFVCSAFRNESEVLSSALIVDAVRITRWYALNKWREKEPDHGFITFVDPTKTKRKRDPGRCFLRAGFVNAGFTDGGLVALQLPPARLAYFPPLQAAGMQSSLFA